MQRLTHQSRILLRQQHTRSAQSLGHGTGVKSDNRDLKVHSLQKRHTETLVLRKLNKCVSRAVVS